MGINSKRERLILANIALLEEITSIKTIRRSMPVYSSLQEFSNQQFPVAAVVGRLPVVAEHKARSNGQIDFCISNLKIDIYVYFIENDIEKMDTEISSLAEDLWVKLYTNPTRDNLCIYTELNMEENIGVMKPYVAFNFTVRHKYQHTIGGI